MPLKIEIPSVGDAASIARVLLESSKDTTFTRSLMVKHPMSPSTYEFFTQLFDKSWGNDYRRVVRDTETGEIVSMCRYRFVAVDSSENWKKRPADTKFPEDLFRGEQLNRTFAASWAKRIEYMGNTAHMNLTELFTLPSAARRGAGSMLMTHVLSEADKYNLPIFLLATPPGKPLYTKFGFVEKAALPLDMSVINEPDVIHWIMIRPQPQPEQPSSVPALPLRAVKVVPIDATMDECRAFEECTDAAFLSEPLIELCFHNAEQETIDERAAKLLKIRENPRDFLCQKAVDTATGEALGYSKWMLCDDPHRDMQPWGPGWPRGCNVPLAEAMFGTLERRRAEHFRKRNEPYIYLASLMILPQAQRRGVGSALLRAGLAESDGRGWPAYVNASPSGAPLYRKFGWKDYTSITLNLKNYGGGDVETTVIGLLRACGATEVPRSEEAT